MQEVLDEPPLLKLAVIGVISWLCVSQHFDIIEWLSLALDTGQWERI